MIWQRRQDNDHNGEARESWSLDPSHRILVQDVAKVLKASKRDVQELRDHYGQSFHSEVKVGSMVLTCKLCG